jgi:signal transduction histidine kinase/pSer/pThr/pTyr-binding forkhead associated (FHA) protein
MPKLLIKSGEKRGSSYRVTDRIITIGRDPSNRIALTDMGVSRRHAKIVPRGKKYIIVDLGSVNGTYVNKEPVTEQVLKIGDTVTVGKTNIQFLHLRAPEKIGEETKETSPSVRLISKEDQGKDLTVQLKLSPPESDDLTAALPERSDPSALNRAYERLSVLYQLVRDLVTIVDFPEVLNKTLERVIDIVKGDRGLIILLDEETGDLVPFVARKREGLMNPGEIAISKSMCREVLESGHSLLSSDAMGDRRFRGSESIMVQKIRSAISAPIKGKERILGVIHVDSTERVISFSRDDLQLLTAIGYQAGIAIENSMLFAEWRRAHLELKEQQNQLIEAEKLSALGKIAGGVAHEVVNPMTVIMGFTAMVSRRLEQESLDSESRQECIRRLRSVEDEAKRVLQIVESISQFYRRKKSDRLLTDVNQEIEGALRIAEYGRESSVQIVKELGANLPCVMADRSQLQTVFLNLINNALDSMDKGGILTITSSLEDGKIKIRFADTGCGIEPAIMGKIFAPLFTTKEEGKGTGLGLSITHDIVENHGGVIDVESRPGKGAVFTVFLPAAE